MLDTGAAIPSSLAWAQQHLAGFSFESHGLGIFTSTLPDIFTNNSGAVWAQPHGSRGEGWRIFEGGSSIYSINWGGQPDGTGVETAQTDNRGTSRFTPISSVAASNIIRDVSNQALEILLAEATCRDALSSSGLGVVAVLRGIMQERLGEGSGIINYSNSTSGSLVAYTYSAADGLQRGHIDLYNMFFTGDYNVAVGNTDSDSLNLIVEQRRMLTFLHELGHLTRRYIHGDNVNYGGSVPFYDANMTDADVNQYVYDNCFNHPEPREAGGRARRRRRNRSSR